MAVPTYATDLALFKDFESAVTFSEFVGFAAGRGQAIDTDFPIQGSSMMSTVMNATGNAGVAVDYGSNIAWTSGWCMFSWLIWLAPAAINTQANGGLVFCLGADISNFREWNVGGSDFGSYPYGGWQNFAVDPEVTASVVTGTPGTAYRWAGPGVRVISAVAKGSPLAVDVIRFGRGEFRVAAGEVGNLATFTGMASTNDNNSNRWGLFQKIDNGYKFKGLMILGYGGLVNFEDSNDSIVIDNTQYVQAGFNRIEIRNASSVVNWTNISIISLSTVSKGQFEVVDDATVSLIGCTFVDMDTFIFKANSTVADSTFRRCGQITAPGSDFRGSLVEGYTGVADTSALVWDVNTNPAGLLDDTMFTRGVNAHHAIEFGLNSPTSLSLTGIEFSGFNTINGQNDSVLHIKRTTGTVTVNVSGCIGTVSYKSAGATVLISNAVTVTLTGLVNPTEVRVYTQDINGDSDVEIDGIEDNTDGTFAFSYTAGEIVNIMVFSVGYLPADIMDYTIPSSAASIPVQQRLDRQYFNPA